MVSLYDKHKGRQYSQLINLQPEAALSVCLFILPKYKRSLPMSLWLWTYHRLISTLLQFGCGSIVSKEGSEHILDWYFEEKDVKMLSYKIAS